MGWQRWWASTSVLAVLRTLASVVWLLSTRAAVDQRPVAALTIGMIALALYSCVRVASALQRQTIELRIIQEMLARVFGSPLAHPSHETTFLMGAADTARIIAEIRPAIIGDALGAVAVLCVGVSTENAVTVVTFIVALGLGAGAVAVMRSALARASASTWAAWEAHADSTTDTIRGATEIVAASAVQRAMTRIEEHFHVWRRTARLVAIESFLVSRAPLGLAVAAAALITLAFNHHVTGGEQAIIVAMLPPFVGLAGGLAGHWRLGGSLASVERVMATVPVTVGTRIPRETSFTLRECSAQYHDKKVLRTISVALATPKLVVVVGPNGSGKSTLLRLLAGLVLPSSGTLEVAGIPFHEIDWPKLRKRARYLPQRPHLPLRDVRAALDFLDDLDEVEMLEALARTGVLDVLRDKNAVAPLAVRINELSAGERQRVAIARIFARPGELYLLDEPDANLDRGGLEHLCNLLTELSRHALVVVAAHTPEVVARAGEVIELRAGAVTEASRADTLA